MQRRMQKRMQKHMQSRMNNQQALISRSPFFRPGYCYARIAGEAL